MTIKYAAVSVGLLAFTAGCPLLKVEAEVQEVCLTYPNVEVDGALAAGAVSKTFAFDDLSALHDLAELDAGIGFTRAQIRLTSGAESLAFVEQFRASVASGDPDTTLPELVFFDCQGDCAPAGNVLDVPASLREDALRYIESDSLLVDIQLRGAIPPTTFKVDIDVCMEGRVAYTLDP